MRSCTHSRGFPVSTCARRNPAQPPSRGCAAKSSESRVRAMAAQAAASAARAGPAFAGRDVQPVRSARRQLRRRPETDLSPHNSQRFLFYFCSCPATHGQESMRATRARSQVLPKTRRSPARHHARRASKPQSAICVQRISTALSRSCSSPRAERGATMPSLGDQKASCGTGGLLRHARDRRRIDLVPRDPLVQPPHVILVRIAGEG